MDRNSSRADAANEKAAAKTDVVIRMFCQGLGDCFLISVPQKGARPYSILIDFGVAMGTPRSDEIMQSVIRKVAELTAGVVDLLVVTHEHWDHVSGFVQASEELVPQKLEFKQLWLAWTEDPRDQLARDLKKKYNKAKLALARARRMAALLQEDPSSAIRLAALDGVLAFHGLVAATGAERPKATIADAMAVPRKLVGADTDEDDAQHVEFLIPGRRLSLPGAAANGTAAGTRVFVLGPPHDPANIVRINPSKRDPETYEKEKHAAPPLAVNWAWLAAALHWEPALFRSDEDPSDSGDFERSGPFDRFEQIGMAEAQDDPFFQQRYFEKNDENQGRRIDGDWVWSGAQRLALQLESYTNNTSLVLAIQLPNSQKVLLFAGDAQVGNWLSWHAQEYEEDDGSKVSATQLLGRTVLYKVGHHGSHNATLRKMGLELMTHPELVAMLPVEADAVKRLGYGEMPLQSLVTALSTSTQGRVLRLDETWQNSKPPGSWKKGLRRARVSAEKIVVGKEGETTERPLYIEYTVRDR